METRATAARAAAVSASAARAAARAAAAVGRPGVGLCTPLSHRLEQCLPQRAVLVGRPPLQSRRRRLPLVSAVPLLARTELPADSSHS